MFHFCRCQLIREIILWIKNYIKLSQKKLEIDDKKNRIFKIYPVIRFEILKLIGSTVNTRDVRFEKQTTHEDLLLAFIAGTSKGFEIYTSLFSGDKRSNENEMENQEDEEEDTDEDSSDDFDEDSDDESVE